MNLAREDKSEITEEKLLYQNFRRETLIPVRYYYHILLNLFIV